MYFLALFCLLVPSLGHPLSDDDPFQLTIIHINDIHAHFEVININTTRCRDDDCYGGVARVQEKKNQILNQDPEALFLNAGDFYQGLTNFALEVYDTSKTTFTSFLTLLYSKFVLSFTLLCYLL